MNKDSIVYQLGENEPFRITKDSCRKLILGLLQSDGIIVSCGIDKTCPPTYGCFRFQFPPDKAHVFEFVSGIKLELSETVVGQ